MVIIIKKNRYIIMKIGILGKGFVGIIDDKSPREDHEKVAEEAIKICKEKIISKKFDVVILDEINYAIDLGLIKTEQVIELIKMNL